jgi:DNA-directed RNA polymerase subunit K/omega
MNQNAIEQAKDGDMASSFKAMRRAAKRARQIAAETGTALVVRHGELITRVTVTDQDDFPNLPADNNK